MKKLGSLVMGIMLTLALAGPVLAGSLGIHVEAINESEREVKVTVTLQTLIDHKDISKTLKPGGRMIFSKSETAHALTEDFIGWEINAGDHCSHVVMPSDTQCRDTGNRCTRSTLETIGDCAYKLTVTGQK